jgi:Periplasmic copper-binding protein (NosD)
MGLSFIRRGVIGVAAVLLAVLGWWAWGVAEAVPSRSATTLGAGHEAPSVYYERLRAELGRAPTAAIDAVVARARQASSIGDLTSCPPVPPPAADLTSNGFYFLTEILPGGIAETSPACGHALACFLGKMVAHQINPNNPPSAYSSATLVIDRQCVVSQTLIVPDRFVIAGVGTEGRGVLAFDLPDNAPAIRFAASAGAPQRFVTIRDLNIVNVPQCCGQIGIDVSNSSFVTLERIRLHDFGFGLLGTTAFSIFVDKSVIHNNGFNVVIGDGSTAWRVRDTVMSQSGLFGMLIGSLAVGNFVSGGRVESNPVTGVRVQGLQNVIEGTWFEGNGIGFGDHGIHVLATADQTRIFANLFSSEDILDQGASTQTCLNTDDNAFADLNNCPH